MDFANKKARLRELIWRLKNNKKAHIWLMGGIILFLLIFLSLSIWWVNKRDVKFDISLARDLNLSQINTTSEPAEMRRLIDGVMVEKSKENLFPYAVIVENLISVRPQAGLQAANLVYEALAEGGITRFLAVYATDELIKDIGPVRSARPYFVTLAEELKGMFLHVGGSSEAINQVQASSNIIDLDAISGDGRFFWRDQSNPAPHNLYTSSEKISYAFRDKILTGKMGVFSPWKFSTAQAKKQRPREEKKITINYYNEDYKVEYMYDWEENVYYRFNGGEKQFDRSSGMQLSAKNIIVQFVPTWLEDEKTGRLAMELIGEGRAVIFFNGAAHEGIWRKSSLGERTRFWDSTDAEIEFISGNIWINLLPLDRNLEYN